MKKITFPGLFKYEPKESIDFERRFILPIALAGVIFSFASILANGFINLNHIVQLTPYFSLVIYFVAFVMALKKKFVTFVKYFIILFTLALINFLWYYNNGSYGPILYLFVLLYSYLIFMVDGKPLLYISVLIAVNIGVLFYLDYENPHLISEYNTHYQQVIDTYVSMFFYGLIIFIMMYLAKTSYVTAYFEAKKSDKAKTRFLEDMSHEVRTPLNAILGFSSLMIENELSEEDREEYKKMIDESNESLLRLVNDILDVSLIEAGKMNLLEEEINITRLIKELKITYDRKIKESGKKLKMILDVPYEDWFILGDAERIRQLLVNLLDNALKFTEKGSITAGLKETDAFIEFYVKDTGIGIDKQYHDKLFDSFYRVEANKEVLFRGTGIGLYLCKKLVTLMGGDIKVDSGLGKGSTFTFSLPKKEFYKKAATDSVEETEELPILEKPDRSFKILVVEDMASSQAYYKTLLLRLGMEVLQAYSGNEGIKKIEENPDIDLILMDIKMPEMDGYTALGEIRKINATVPVIAQTAFAMEQDREDCLKAGFTDYLAKPVSKEDILRIINKYL